MIVVHDDGLSLPLSIHPRGHSTPFFPDRISGRDGGGNGRHGDAVTYKFVLFPFSFLSQNTDD